MGDRASVVMSVAGEADVYLYTHSGGANLPIVVQRALKRQLRWNDSPYLARIIFSEMIKGHEDDEYGFGISSYKVDNDRPLIIVGAEENAIVIRGYIVSFADFITMETSEIFRMWEGQLSWKENIRE